LNGNSIGKALVLTCFGESHGRCVGVVIDGCPAGLPISQEEIQVEMDKRKPGLTEVSTTRREEDTVEILSGIYDNFTSGAPICMVVWNRDVDSSPYELMKEKPRPGQIGVQILAHTVQIGSVKLSRQVSHEDIHRNVYQNSVRCADPDVAEAMKEEILKASKDRDSVGGVVEGLALSVPAGLGDPIIDALDSDIAKMMFSIPAVKGVEFGAGFEVASMRGSENNDQYALREGRIVTLTNNAGGVLGGISTGMPIMVRVAVKPTSSISRRQKTVDLNRMKDTEIELKGRHDPCIVPRAVPVVEACLAFVLADHAIRAGRIPTVLR